MNSSGIVLVAIGLIIAAISGFALRRRLAPVRPWQPGDGISLIELAVSKIDRNFVPAGEMQWERKTDRLICWFGLFVGVALVLVGLWYGQK